MSNFKLQRGGLRLRDPPSQFTRFLIDLARDPLGTTAQFKEKQRSLLTACKTLLPLLYSIRPLVAMVTSYIPCYRKEFEAASARFDDLCKLYLFRDIQWRLNQDDHLFIPDGSILAGGPWGEQSQLQLLHEEICPLADQVAFFIDGAAQWAISVQGDRIDLDIHFHYQFDSRIGQWVVPQSCKSLSIV